MFPFPSPATLHPFRANPSPACRDLLLQLFFTLPHLFQQMYIPVQVQVHHRLLALP